MEWKLLHVSMDAHEFFKVAVMRVNSPKEDQRYELYRANDFRSNDSHATLY